MSRCSQGGFAIALLLLLAVSAHAASIRVVPLADPSADTLMLGPGDMSLLSVIVENVADPGLAAFQFDLNFDPSVITLFDPNDGSPFDPFMPLGAESFCAIVRGDPCPDPPWFLTETGRDTLLASSIVDNATGFLQLAYATLPGADPPVGGGSLAVIGVMATSVPGQTVLELSNIILSDNSEPPMGMPLTSVGNLTVGMLPEPTTASLLTFGIGAVVLSSRRRRS